MELGFEDVSLLERCLHFRGCYASMEFGPKQVSQWSKVTLTLTHSFRSEVLQTSELVQCTPSSSPACSVVACLVEVTFLCHQLRDVRLRVWRGGGGGGEKEERKGRR